jgi:tRNA A-37 threonylcarbamoyl transferase component Bud32
MTNLKFRKIKFLGKGKSGNSFLIEMDGRPCVLKEMHNEKVSYYNFSKDKLELELEAYSILEQLPIRIPKIISFNLKEYFLIKEFVNGPTLVEVLITSGIPDKIFQEIFEWSSILKTNNLNIDYFPNNFVVKDNQLYYIDYEFNTYSDEWNFENWGIYYWLNPSGFFNFIKTNDSKYINIPNSSKPIITEEIEIQKQELLKRLTFLINNK